MGFSIDSDLYSKRQQLEPFCLTAFAENNIEYHVFVFCLIVYKFEIRNILKL
uniref:Uncharacterized protein n=1 Tax=Solanum lycopersicum TaxID=4081 RepID=A0A3Q7GZ68_SOLLC